MITEDLLRRFDVPGPRYTSYPTADRFVEAFTARDLRRALAERRVGGAGAGSALSVYVHIPFCESLCYFCACNKIITRHHERAAPYLTALMQEMDLYAASLGPGSTVTQLHLGGGTPTFLSNEELRTLMDGLRQRLFLAPDAECAIEVDPRTVDRARLKVLAELGFNRLSFGVQDFDPEVQRAVHRVQPREQVEALVQAARDIGFSSINVDLIYGLPRQTERSFARTIAEVSALRPDRIAMYAYAHLPARFKPQRRIHAQELPAARDKVAMLAAGLDGFTAAGYTYIGMDHFALTDDALAVAKRHGLLHRNFQGYTTEPDGDMLGLGVSAIGRVGSTYAQNGKSMAEYLDALAQGEFPVVRGLALTRDDVLRRAVIMALMCQGRVEYESIEAAHLVDFHKTFAHELSLLKPMQELGLVHVDNDGIQVTPIGWYFVRGVAMVFDRHVQADRNRERFSRVI